MPAYFGGAGQYLDRIYPDTRTSGIYDVPRALAVAEIGWTPQELRTWEDFKPRMNAHISKLQGMGIRTFTLSDELEVTMQVDTAGREIEVILDAEKYPAEIRYTTDGSVPVASSALYAGPITVQDSAHIKAAIFRDGVLQGTPTEKKVDYHRAINKLYIIIVSSTKAIWPEERTPCWTAIGAV